MILGVTASQESGPSYSDEVLADSPVAYWRLEETSGTSLADSSSGGARTGTAVSSPTLTTTGAVGSAASFVGGSRITVANHADLVAMGDFTLECFVKTTWTGIDAYALAVYETTGNQRCWGLVLNGTDDTAELYLSTNGSAGTTGLCLTTLTALYDNAWHHLAFTRSGSTLVCYFDGTAQSSTATTLAGTLFNATADMGMGARASGAGAITTSLDEVAIYRTALSAARISAHVAAA